MSGSFIPQVHRINFSRNHQDLIVYRPTWLSFSCKQEDCDTQDLPLKAKKFESFFTQLYSVPLASASELICKDFFLYSETNQFGLFATSTAQIYDAPATGGAIQGVPSIEKITFHLLRYGLDACSQLLSSEMFVVEVARIVGWGCWITA